jgi:hypothetical protein
MAPEALLTMLIFALRATRLIDEPRRDGERLILEAMQTWKHGCILPLQGMASSRSSPKIRSDGKPEARSKCESGLRHHGAHYIGPLSHPFQLRTSPSTL